MRVFRLMMAVVVTVCLLPVASVLIASGLAGLGGCPLDEGSVHPCVVGGVDAGGALYMMAVAGWFALATLPVLGIALLVWSAVEILHFVRKQEA
ncbi:MAG: hypothetical protein WCD20_19130 [Rhodomicrobium sp.]